MKSVAVPGFEVPTDRNGQLWVHFAKHDTGRRLCVGCSMCWMDAVGPDKISRKLILIGTSAVGLLDVKTTPLDPVMPGVEVHAQVLESALTLVRCCPQPNYAVAAELCAAFLFGVAIIWLPRSRAPLLLRWRGLIALLFGASWYLFAGTGSSSISPSP